MMALHITVVLFAQGWQSCHATIMLYSYHVRSMCIRSTVLASRRLGSTGGHEGLTSQDEEGGKRRISGATIVLFTCQGDIE